MGILKENRRKLLKTAHTEERSVHTNSESYNIYSTRIVKNQFNSKQIIQKLLITISTHS